MRKVVEVFVGRENKRNKKLKAVCLTRNERKWERKKILDQWWVQPAVIFKQIEQLVTPKLRSAARNRTPVLLSLC